MKQYSSLIVAAIRARRKKLKPGQLGFVYFEWHHVYPTCLVVLDTGDEFAIDGRDANKVLLTFAEHVEAHVLLANLYPWHQGLQSTPDYLLKTRGKPVSVEIAGAARKLSSEAQSRLMLSLSKEKKLWVQSDEGRAAKAIAWEGDKHPMKKPENRAAMGRRQTLAWSSDSNPAKKLENRAAKAIAWEGDKHPMKKPENRKAQSERNREQVTCSHCNKTGGWAGMRCYHFDRCLLHPDNLGLTRKQIKTRLQGLLK